MTKTMTENQTIRAVSLWQPWGELIVCGSKHFETRSWSTNHRGPILIHAAKRYPTQEKKWTQSLYRLGHLDRSPRNIPLGALIGICRLIEVWSSEHPMLDAYKLTYEKQFGDFRPGRFAWELEDVLRFEKPVSYRGRQGLFRVPAEALPEEARDYLHLHYPQSFK